MENIDKKIRRNRINDGIHYWNDFQQVFLGTFNKKNHLVRNSPMNLVKDASEGWKCYCSNNMNNNTPVIGSSEHVAWYKGKPGYNVLDSNRWSLGVNKAWIQGGIDRKAIFKLVSPETSEFVWDCSENRPRVYEEELKQLKRIGYVKIANHMCRYACLQILTETLVEDPTLSKALRALRIIYY